MDLLYGSCSINFQSRRKKGEAFLFNFKMGIITQTRKPETMPGAVKQHNAGMRNWFLWCCGCKLNLRRTLVLHPITVHQFKKMVML
jgi:hypothetical protein